MPAGHLSKGSARLPGGGWSQDPPVSGERLLQWGREAPCWGPGARSQSGDPGAEGRVAGAWQCPGAAPVVDTTPHLRLLRHGSALGQEELCRSGQGAPDAPLLAQKHVLVNFNFHTVEKHTVQATRGPDCTGKLTGSPGNRLPAERGPPELLGTPRVPAACRAAREAGGSVLASPCPRSQLPPQLPTPPHSRVLSGRTGQPPSGGGRGADTLCSFSACSPPTWAALGLS